MLSSLILSLVMSATPTAVTVNDLNLEVTGTRRGNVRIDTKSTKGEKIGTRRGTVRIDAQGTNVEEIGTRRGTVRI
jgi:hypothetical protein